MGITILGFKYVIFPFSSTHVQIFFYISFVNVFSNACLYLTVFGLYNACLYLKILICVYNECLQLTIFVSTIHAYI